MLYHDTWIVNLYIYLKNLRSSQQYHKYYIVLFVCKAAWHGVPIFLYHNYLVIDSNGLGLICLVLVFKVYPLNNDGSWSILDAVLTIIKARSNCWHISLHSLVLIVQNISKTGFAKDCGELPSFSKTFRVPDILCIPSYAIELSW